MAESNRPPYLLITLGTAVMRIGRPGGDVSDLFGAGKPLAILTYLDASPAHRAGRDHLIDLLWADLAPGDARHALRQMVWYLRRHLGDDALVSTTDEIALALPIQSDRRAFLDAIDAGQADRAVTIYGGDFLPNYAAPGGAAFEHWADMERRRLRLALLRAAQVVVRNHLTVGRIRAAQELARRVREMVPDLEAAQRLALEASLTTGDPLAIAMDADRLRDWLGAERRQPESSTAVLLERAAGHEVTHTAGAAGAGHLQSIELIGREQEFNALLAAFTQARSGCGRHLHVRGKAGYGKTRLLAEVGKRFRASGVRTVAAQAHQGEQAVPYSLVADLAARLAQLPGAAAVSPGSAASLVALHPSLSAQYPQPPETAEGSEALRRRTRAMLELLGAIADEHPIAVLLDDLHWADDMSRQVIHGISQRVRELRCLLVSTARPHPDALGVPLAGDVLELAAFSEEQIAALVASLGGLPQGEAWTAQFADRLRSATGGSPLYALETLQLATERGLLSLRDAEWSCEDPATLWSVLESGSALRHRIRQLTVDHRRLLGLVACVGTPVEESLLAAAADRDPTTMGPQLAALEALGLLGRAERGWVPGHDEVGSMVLDEMATNERESMHGAVGRAMAANANDDPSMLRRAVRQLAAAGAELELATILARLVRVLQMDSGRTDVGTMLAELLDEPVSSPRVAALTRQLPLALRLGLSAPTRRRRVALAAAAGTLALLTMGSVALSRVPAAPDAVLYAIGRPTPDSVRVYEVPIRGDAQTPPYAMAPRELQYLRFQGASEHWSPSPDGTRWVVSLFEPSSGDLELFLFQDGAPPRRLTRSPGDDTQPTWSPDGRQLAFITRRWSQNGSGGLAILDLDDLEVRRLFASDTAPLRRPTWSPLGTTIAFEREMASKGPSATCVINVMGEGLRCFTTIPSGSTPAGWRDERHLVVEVFGERTTSVSILDVVTGVSSPVPLGNARPGSVRAAGEWITMDTDDTRNPHSPPAVFHIARPDVRLEPAGLPSPFELHSTALRIPAAAGSQLESIAITPLVDEIPLVAPMQLAIEGALQNGQPVSVPPPATWTILDTAVAHITPSGLFVPKSEGSTWVIAEAAGWRSDSISVRVGRPASWEVLHEDWRELNAWALWGEPRPVVRTGPAETRGLATNGDANAGSGVYSRRSFAATRGLRIDITLSAVLTQPEWQGAQVGLAALDRGTLERWDHRTGGIRVRPDELICMMSLSHAGNASGGIPPGHELVILQSRSSQEETAIPNATPLDRWRRFSLQLLPDGTCNVALEGRPILRTSAAGSLPDRLHVLLEGRMYETVVLHGPLSVVEGVPEDIDWREFAPPPADGQ